MKNLPLIIFLLLVGQYANAQEVKKSTGEEIQAAEGCTQKELLGNVFAGGVFGRALGEFANNYDGISAGYGFSLMMNMERLPFIQWGIGYTESKLKATKLPNEMFEYDKVKLKTRMHEFYGEARLSPFKNNIRPYVFALAGFRSINDVVRVKDYDEDVVLFKNKNIPFFTGLGAGIIIGKPGKLNYEVKFQKTEGGLIDLVNHDTFTPTDLDEFFYTTSETRSDYFSIHVGISLAF